MAREEVGALVTRDGPVPVVPGQSWPVIETLPTTTWDQPPELATTLVARQSPRSGKVGAPTFLLDLGCLGIKNVIVRLAPSSRDYANGLRADMRLKQEFAPADFDLAAKVVLTAEAYARALGLTQPADAAQAKLLLAGADPAACAIPVPTGGTRGKPFFMAGPSDDARRIIAHLTRTLGEGNFDFYVPQDRM